MAWLLWSETSGSRRSKALQSETVRVWDRNPRQHATPEPPKSYLSLRQGSGYNLNTLHVIPSNHAAHRVIIPPTPPPKRCLTAQPPVFQALLVFFQPILAYSYQSLPSPPWPPHRPILLLFSIILPFPPHPYLRTPHTTSIRIETAPWSGPRGTAASPASLFYSSALSTSVQNGVTGLIVASSCGHLEVARLLLDRGAAVNAANKVYLLRTHAAGQGHSAGPGGPYCTPLYPAGGALRLPPHACPCSRCAALHSACLARHR